MQTEQVMCRKPSYHMLLTISVLLAVCFRSNGEPMEMCQEASQPYDGGVFLRCNGRNYTAVPKLTPNNVTGLDLSRNHFNNVSAGAFQNMSKLLFLDLSFNEIAVLDGKAFDGLSRLKILNLTNNKIEMTYASLPGTVFEPLSNLIYLNIYDNAYYLKSYLDDVFEPLVKLEFLSINAVRNTTFRKGFSNLTNLQSLIIGGDVKERLAQYSTNTFEAFANSSLKNLQISFSQFDLDSDVDFLHPLNHLDSLSLDNSIVGLQTAMHFLRTLAGRNMSVLNLNKIAFRSLQLSSILDDIKLSKNDTKYLTQICVKKLHLNSNRIVWIEKDALCGEPFINCIEYIDVSQNFLLGDAVALFNLHKYQQLKYIDISNQFNRYKYHNQEVPKLTEHNANSSEQSAFCVDTSKQLMFGSVDNQFSANMYIYNTFQNVDGDDDNNNKVVYTINLPHNFEGLDVSSASRYSNKDVLRTFKVNFRGGQMDVLLVANLNAKLNNYVFGVENVSVLDISGNDLTDLKVDFFNHFPNLVTLKLAQCSLLENPWQSNRGIIFRNLSKLANLDMSYNYLFQLPDIEYPENLVELKLSYNRFENIPLDLTKTSNLTFLDLSFNYITEFDSQALASMDDLAETNNFRLALKGNILSCACHSLGFVMWLGETKVILDNKGNYSCIRQDGSLTNTKHLIVNYEKYWMSCQGQFFFVFSISMLAFLFVLFTSSYFFLRHPFKTKNLILRLLGLGVYPLTRRHFSDDIFLGYCEHDYRFVYANARNNLEDRHQLKLFLLARDTIPGGNKHEEVIDGMNNSWRTILFVTRAFLADDESYFMIRRAVHSVSVLTPRRIILLLQEPVNHAELPQDLLNVVEEEDIYDYQHYLRNEGERSMWDSIARKIRRQI